MTLDRDRRNFLRGSAGLAAGAGAALALAPVRAGAEKLKPAYEMSEAPLDKSDWSALLAEAERVFAQNRVRLERGYIHMPSVNQYTSLFAWDSGWHAIAMSRVDPAIAASEIETLFSYQEENGRVSHNTYLEEIDQEPGFKSKMAKLMGSSQYDEMGRSAMIDPPSYIVAAEKVHARLGDRDWLGRMLPKLEACVDYMTQERDLFGDGLVSVIHPWETGTDSSPAYDDILGLDFRTPLGAPHRGLLYPRLLDYNAKFGWDPKIAAEKNRFVLEDICFNSITIRAVRSVANLYRLAGDAEKAERHDALARSMADAVERINWVESEGCYFSRYDAKGPRLAMRTTASSMLPLMTGLVAKDRAERVVEEHLKNPEEFWMPFVVTFNARDEIEAEKVYLEDLLLWRGHCIWTNMNWMINEALLEYGHGELAREVTRRTARMILHEGFWEFYDYRNGQGKGARDFNWPGLVLDMIARTWPEIVA